METTKNIISLIGVLRLVKSINFALSLRKFLTFSFLGLVFCSATYVFSSSVTAFDTSAKQAILVDDETGTVLFAKNEELPMSPASMSKLMTLYVCASKTTLMYNINQKFVSYVIKM